MDGRSAASVVLLLLVVVKGSLACLSDEEVRRGRSRRPRLWPQWRERSRC